ncbi:MAG: hypothetical protein KAQ89_05380 [Planctomycetes bacterium]|nr:hypothetical protein [Planctomycetota bacterium]
MSFSLGDSFSHKHLPSLHSHLWIVISELTNSLEQVIIVNFTSCRDSGDIDQSCLLNKGEHPFLMHKTYVNYRDAQIPQICNLKKAEAAELITRKEPISKVLLAKILEGAKASPFLKFEFRKILEDQNLI